MIDVGADLLTVYWVIPHGKEPDWEAAWTVLTEAGEGDEAKPAGSALNEVIACWNHERRDADVIQVREYDVLFTAGMSWGDSPTAAFDDFQTVSEEAMKAAGFIDANTNAVTLVFDEGGE